MAVGCYALSLVFYIFLWGATGCKKETEKLSCSSTPKRRPMKRKETNVERVWEKLGRNIMKGAGKAMQEKPGKWGVGIQQNEKKRLEGIQGGDGYLKVSEGKEEVPPLGTRKVIRKGGTPNTAPDAGKNGSKKQRRIPRQEGVARELVGSG